MATVKPRPSGREERLKRKTDDRRLFSFAARHETFCQHIVAGLSHKDAYLGAGFKAGAAHGTGPDLMLKRQAIKDRIAELQALQRVRLNITMDTILLELDEAWRKADRLDRPEAMVTASMAKAKLLGLLTDKAQIDLNIIPMPSDRPLAKTEYTVEEWVAEFSPKQITGPGNGHG